MSKSSREQLMVIATRTTRIQMTDQFTMGLFSFMKNLREKRKMTRRLVSLLLALATLLPAAPVLTQASSQQPSTSRDQSKKSKNKSGDKSTAPKGATAKCKDGTYSFAKHHQGACSHHGGVAEWYK